MKHIRVLESFSLKKHHFHIKHISIMMAMLSTYAIYNYVTILGLRDGVTKLISIFMLNYILLYCVVQVITFNKKIIGKHHVVFIYGMSFIVTLSFLYMTIGLCPDVFDKTAVLLDGKSGFEIRAWTHTLIGRYPFLSAICTAVYGMLLPMMAASCAALMREGNGRHVEFVVGYLLIGGIGYLLYLAMPVVGPLYYSGDGWANDMMATGGASAVPRNCMPSLHTAWVLLAYLSLRRSPWRIVAAGFACVTLLAILGLGLHYICDIAAAAPLVLLTMALSRRSAPLQRRLAAVILGAGLLAVWVAVVRGWIDATAWSMPLMAGTVALSLACESALSATAGNSRSISRSDAAREDARNPRGA